jgi:predicted MFS family arabinose efflux permease
MKTDSMTCLESGSRPKRILPVIVISQFAGTSLWFAGNAVLPGLQETMHIGPEGLGWMTSSIQLGFITGTLLFAWLALPDRFSPRLIFLACSLAGGLFNLGILAAGSLTPILALRFLCGLCLAGVYPVGMKIAAGWYREGLGRAIGYLVGALVAGSALPFLVRSIGGDAPWQWAIISVSSICAGGGILMAVLVPDGPYHTQTSGIKKGAVRQAFASKQFRASVFGYFGHMWELYTLYTFTPAILALYFANHSLGFDNAFWSFCVIGSGTLGCIGGGIISVRRGSASVAFVQLFASGLCCLALPLMMQTSPIIFLSFMVFWGIVVVGDSPQFSALNAQTAPKELVGSSLTVATSIGFALTIASIEIVSALSRTLALEWLLFALAIGPVFGLLSMRPLFTRTTR